MKKNLSTKIENLQKAINALEQSINTPIKEPRDLSGIVKDFEICYELIWKVLKLYLANEGHETNTARDSFATAFQLKIISNQTAWLSMIDDRNLTVHVYNQPFAQEMIGRIKSQYFTEFKKLYKYLEMHS